MSYINVLGWEAALEQPKTKSLKITESSFYTHIWRFAKFSVILFLAVPRQLLVPERWPVADQGWIPSFIRTIVFWVSHCSRPTSMWSFQWRHLICRETILPRATLVFLNPDHFFTTWNGQTFCPQNPLKVVPIVWKASSVGQICFQIEKCVFLKIFQWP